MAFLSLGLHNDEPPISSDQGGKKPSARERSGKGLSITPGPTPEAQLQQRATLPTNAPTVPDAPPFLSPDRTSQNGNTHPAIGNGHMSLAASGDSAEDDFDDRFNDDEGGVGGLSPQEFIKNVLSGAPFPSDSPSPTTHPSNGNGNGSSSTPGVPRDMTPGTGDGRARTPPSSQPSPHPAPALPAGVEQLRRKLAEEEKLRAARVRPAALAASVTSLSSSERHWVPTFSTFKFGYLPGRGLLFSTIGHEVLIFGLFLLITYVLPSMQSQKLIVTNNTQDRIIYLPELGGGSEGEKSPGTGESAPQQPAAAPARASKGFAYPGRQAILSNPPNPTNAFQTIQRPLLVHPEEIHKLVPLPNIVQMAETRLPSDLIAPKAAMPQLKEVPKPIRVKQDSLTHRDAKFNVPVDAPKLVSKMEMPNLPAAEQPLPEAPKVQPKPKQEEEKREVEKPSPNPIKVTTEKRAEKSEKQVAPPSAAQIARMEMHGKAKEPLLSLSPMPLPAGPDAKVPNGEARGKFAIAPGGTLNPNAITPGKTNGTPSVTPGTGQENAKAPNAAGSDTASTAGSSAAHGTAGSGGPGHATVASGSGSTGTGGGTGNTAGEGTGGPGTGKGHGSTGKGAGSSGDREANGSGSGAGSGSGTGSFAGITIQGGEQAETKPKNKPAFTIEPQASYGLTIVSTASSGGGLEDFGVFQNERIFTVYVPVKPSPELADPTWTMQYAIIKDSSISDPGSQQVVAPSVASSEWPQIPPALAKKYAQHQIVIYAVVSKEGKVSQVSVKRTPDPRVSDPIANALKKWIFHPAEVNNQPASVKILLGIPLT
jgi:hypothetical protein